MITSKNKMGLKVGEPNLIPLLDFMLVLIVMFVLLAGPVREAVKLPVPEVKNGAAASISRHLMTINVANKNNIYINQQHFTNLNQVEEYLKAQSQPVTEVVIAIDKNLEVDTLLKLFAINKTLGITTANIQVETETK